MSNKPTFAPGERLSMEFAGTVSENHFVNFSGDLCSIDENIAGISDLAYVSGDFGSVITTGTALLRLGAEVSVGTELTSDASGHGIAATSGDYVGAIALSAGVTGIDIEVLPTRYIK